MSPLAARVAAIAALCLLPCAAFAQSTIIGSAEVDVTNSSTQNRDQESHNGMVDQNYSLGWNSSLWDQRLVQYNLEGSFRTSALGASSTGVDRQSGHAGDLGYRVGTQLLSASAFPFSFQMSRSRSNSAGDLGPSNPIRSGIVAASGAPPSDFESLNRDLNLGWHLGLAWLPTVDLAYRKGDAVISGGHYQATQSNSDFSTTVTRNSKSVHHLLRYQAANSENVLEQTYAQRLGFLDYDFGATTSAHSRLTLHAGHRSVLSHLVFQAPVDTTGAAYAPPTTTGGTSSAEYGQIGYTYEPTNRFALRANGNVDRQAGDAASTSAALATLSAQVGAYKGFTFTANGTAGERQQIIAANPITVATRGADGVAAYQLFSRWLDAGASAARGMGTSTTLEGVTGSNDSWSGDGHLSTTIRWFGAAAGYSRSRYRDDLLELGNYTSEQLRSSAQIQTRRGSITASADNVTITRGRELAFARNQQRTLSATAAFRLRGQSVMSATVGHFVNDYVGVGGAGIDSNFFWGAGADIAFRSKVHLTGWLRTERTSATRTQFDQDSLSAFARADYRLRTLKFALEYRKSHSLSQYPGMLMPDRFAGSQLRFSVIRQFGMVMR